MKRDAAEILKEALALPTEARAALAGSLLDSLDTEVDEDAEAAWATEINRRIAELDSGAVKTIPWAEVRRRPPRGDAAVRGRVPPARRRRSRGRGAVVRERNETASARFRCELDHAVDLICERPETGSPYLSNTRRVLLRRFPFFVVYRARAGDLEIIAIAHARRRPGYWRAR
jgi:putative addiction module component (TIGR02574 family)